MVDVQHVVPLTTPGGMFALVRDGRAASRADLTRLTGLAASTVTLRVEQLLAAGYLAETGDGASRGGRRPRLLTVAADDGVVAGVDLGGRHATTLLCDAAGRVLSARRRRLDIALGPEAVLGEVHREVQQAVAELEGRSLRGIGLSLPGPVGVAGSRVVSPSRMPGWNGVDAAALLSALTGVVVRVENDANALAWAELVAAGRRTRHLVVVKAGSGIGAGIVAGGALHRGARGVAGDVSHTAVAEGPPVPCSCGRLGCLDAVAGGRALVAALAGSGAEVAEVGDVVALAHDGHPQATRLLRESGRRTGAVLATVVSFFDPERLVLAGALSVAEAFVAGFRASIYDLCPPFSTAGLEIEESQLGWEGGARGAAGLVLEEILDAETVNRRVRS